MEPMVHVIVPITWIEDIDSHWEKFVNESINRNQRFKVFYSQEADATDDFGWPDLSYVPNFTVAIDPQFPATGCYKAKLVAYKGKCDCEN